jgi:hypothetical protein
VGPVGVLLRNGLMGMVVRFHIVVRPYKIKTQSEVV